MRADFHMHSTASDGLLTPTELMLACRDAGMECVALTDHDNTDGLLEAKAAAEAADMQFICGVELTVQETLREEVHLLGYGLRPQDAELSGFLQEMQEERRIRAKSILDKLDALGFSLRYQDVEKLASRVISRSHIALAMVRGGMEDSVSGVFEKYLSPGKPAYVPRTHLRIGKAIALLHRAGAVAVLAHPGRLHLQDMELRRRIQDWRQQGLDGVEVYHPSHSEGQMRWLRQIAREEHMLITGGSDFHAKEVRHATIGQMLPYWGAEISGDVQALRGAVAERSRKVTGEDAPASSGEE